MCCDTKAKIAAAVRELMQKRPVSKITVQDVMERTDMTRQSFYYHFQDIYNVLEWNITECMKDELKFRKDQSFEDWCRLVMSMLRDNQAFCRKVGDALGRNKIQEILLPYVRPQMERLRAACVEKGPLCVGLDTDPSYIPPEVLRLYDSAPEAALAYNLALIDATAADAACYKVQVAYYEAMGRKFL